MRFFIQYIFPLILSAATVLQGQGFWTVTGRVHPELEWHTLKTSHFNIHYHTGIEEIAYRGAQIAEQVRPALLKQVGLETIRRIDIIFTAEDEISNGFAQWTYQTFIWVDQNDITIRLEGEKWLPQVINHELQHIVLFEAIKTWLPEPWSLLLSGVPAWFIEGAAEYFTETWRPYRSDLSHKYHVLKNSLDRMDPHHDGYSKTLYFADRFGDSVLVNLISKRNKLKLLSFGKNFKRFTGTSVRQFNEDWRRQMNTYYYGIRVQKETIEELGRVVSLPVKYVDGFKLSRDSLKIAIAGRIHRDQRYESLWIGVRDTVKMKRKDQKKSRYKWKLKEIDAGNFHTIMDWSSDGQRLVYAKYHYGRHQSLVWDLKIAEALTGRTAWITESMRAANPVWLQDDKYIVFISHSNSTSNLFKMNPDSKKMIQLTDYPFDTQLITPQIAQDDRRLVYGKSSPKGNVDLYQFDLETEIEKRLTYDPAVDTRPLWHPDGDRITFTSHRNGTPNLFTLQVNDNNIVQVTDVGEAVWGVQWTPGDSTITAMTLGDVDSVRIVQVDPLREITTESLSLRDNFSSWKTTIPDTLLPQIDYDIPVNMDVTPYLFWKSFRPITHFVFPNLNAQGLFGLTAWNDALGKHVIQLAGGFDVSDELGNWLYFVYVNAQHGSLWALNVYKNIRWSFRPYDRSLNGLAEALDGVQWFTYIPFNLGEDLHARHLFTAGVSLHRRNVILPSDSLDTNTGKFIPRLPGEYRDLPFPEEGDEMLVTLRYRWTNRRPDMRNFILPRQGLGVQTQVDWASDKFFGDFSYTRVSMEGFSNFMVVGPLTLFGRLKTQAMFGYPPVQDSLGLTRDLPVYYSLGTIDLGIITVPEVHNPRGWDGVRLGDRLIFGSLELRFPIIRSLPVNVLGVTLGAMTGAVFTDFGNAWTSGESADDWISTAGYESRIALQIGGFPLVHISLGEAQTFAEWQVGDSPRSYIRLALINPF
jgi:hypothetical protein